jgi:hypothetical protein
MVSPNPFAQHIFEKCQQMRWKIPAKAAKNAPQKTQI